MKRVLAIIGSAAMLGAALAAVAASQSTDAVIKRPSYDLDDISAVATDCLTFAVFVEARDQRIEGQIAVAESILERSRLGYEGGHPCDIVLAPKQYDGMARWPQGVIPADVDPDAWFTARIAVDAALRGRYRSSCFGATHFFAHRHVVPDWALDREACIIGAHTFIRV